MSTKFGFSQRILIQASNIKFHEYPSSLVALIHADGRMDVTKLKADFRTCANAPKNRSSPVKTIL
jgi:hypothetical protein